VSSSLDRIVGQLLEESTDAPGFSICWALPGETASQAHTRLGPLPEGSHRVVMLPPRSAPALTREEPATLTPAAPDPGQHRSRASSGAAVGKLVVRTSQ